MSSSSAVDPKDERGRQALLDLQKLSDSATEQCRLHLQRVHDTLIDQVITFDAVAVL
jgi:hypothetical protein